MKELKLRIELAQTIQNVRQTREDLVLFLVCGVLSAGVYYAVIFVALEIISLRDSLAASAGYAISSCFNFFFNRHITFKSGENKVHGQAMRYALLLVASYVVSISIIEALLAVTPLSLYVISAIAILSITGGKYLLSRFYVYV